MDVSRLATIAWYFSFTMWLAGGMWLWTTSDSFLYRVLGTIAVFASLIAISYRAKLAESEDNMSKPEDSGTESAPGQQKTYVVTHPTDPSSPRTVTQAQWREEKLGQKGWSKPDDMPE